MSNRLSHSQVTKYNDCSKAWDFYYNKRIRSKTKSSALVFGNILDESVGVYLETKNSDEAHSKLIELWETQEVNKVVIPLKKCTDIVYSNSDLDVELLLDEDLEELRSEYGSDVLDKVKNLYKQKAAIGYDLLKKKDKILINHVNWFSMLRKGQLMLNKAIEIIDKNVEEVLGIQVPVSLENNDGDSIIGFADFVVRWKGYKDPIIFDLKTSSILYTEDSAKYSPQLTLYVHDLKDKFKTRNCGFLVLNKRVQKNRGKVCKVCGYDGSSSRHKSCANEIDGERCGGEYAVSVKPEINYQIIIDEVTEHVENLVLDNMDAVNRSIKAEIYQRNFSSCMKPWGKCEYYDLCWSNKKDGLREV